MLIYSNEASRFGPLLVVVGGLVLPGGGETTRSFQSFRFLNILFSSTFVRGRFCAKRKREKRTTLSSFSEQQYHTRRGCRGFCSFASFRVHSWSSVMHRLKWCTVFVSGNVFRSLLSVRSEAGAADAGISFRSFKMKRELNDLARNGN